jgi:hypothetical protein
MGWKHVSHADLIVGIWSWSLLQSRAITQQDKGEDGMDLGKVREKRVKRAKKSKVQAKLV